MKNLTHHNKRAGLTVIELFVIIALMSLTIAIMTSSIFHIRAQARDSIRLSDMTQLRNALSLYYAGKQHFPIIKDTEKIDGYDQLSKVLLREKLIGNALIDPDFPTYSYHYASNKRGTDYVLTFCLETESISGYLPGCSNTLLP